MDIAMLTKEEVFSTYDLSFLEKPSFGGWSIERDLCQFIGKLCETYRPSRVLEFGTGLSTFILAEEVRRKNIGACFSIDHLKCIQDKIKTTLSQQSEQHLVHFHHFPLGLTYEGGKLFYFYKISEEFLIKNGPFDLILVDGPPGFYKSREAILYRIFPYLTSAALVVLDDAHRKGEQACLENWKWYFGNGIRDVLLYRHFKKGLACVNVLGSGGGPKNSFSLKERWKSSLQGVKALISHSLQRGRS